MSTPHNPRRWGKSEAQRQAMKVEGSYNSQITFIAIDEAAQFTDEQWENLQTYQQQKEQPEGK
jgi:uncharacterized membrane protein